jgi:signal transduction histidine kinase
MIVLEGVKTLVYESNPEKIETILLLFEVSCAFTNCGMVIVSNDEKILSVNNEFLKMWGILDSNLTNLFDNSYTKCQLYLEKQIKEKSKLNKVFNKKIDIKNNDFNLLKLKDGRVFAQTLLNQKLNNQTIVDVYFFWDIGKLSKIFESQQYYDIKEQNLRSLNQNEHQDRSENIKYRTNQITKKSNQAQSKNKSIFFSMLCHQFRSLLNVVSFSNSLLKRSISAQESQQDNLFFINNIQSGIEDITQLLDELIFYGELETGAIEYKPDLIELNLYCSELVAQTQKIANNKQQTINLQIDSNSLDDNTTVVYLDKKLLKPTLINLLANALKYSPKNSTIFLKISCQKQKILFQIEDRGIGIEKKDLSKIFEPFFRGNNVANIKGNGIGLAIVNILVAIQGGSISVFSQTEVGTTFTVTLPCINSFVK